MDIGNDELWQIDDEPDTVQVDSWASQTWPCLYFKKPLESRQYIIDDSQNIPPQTTSSAVVSTEAIQASESKEPVMNKPESPGTMILKAATATRSSS